MPRAVRTLARALRDLVFDVRFALALMARAPAFAATALLTIALGIGGATAMFSIVDGVLLRPLPYAQPDRLVRLYEVDPKAGVDRSNLSLPDLDDWQLRSGAFAGSAGFVSMRQVLMGRGDPLELRAVYVTSGFFGVLGATPLVGRLLDAEDEAQANRNVVISSGIWRSVFAASPDVIGTTVSLGDGKPFTIVGVASPSLRFPAADVALWMPQAVLGDRVNGPRTRDSHNFEAVARLAPGVTVENAATRVDAVAAQLASEYPASNARWTAGAVVPLRATIVGQVQRSLELVFALVALILLIACANVAHLLLARGAARAHEIATRMALGAGPARIARQLIAESCGLALLGGALGVGIAFVVVRTVLALYADSLPRAEDVGVDLRVLAFACLVSLAAGVVFGSLPAWRLARSDPRRHLAHGRGAVAGGGRSRQMLVAVEVALALILVVGAGLMARSFLGLRSVDPGFDMEHVLTVTTQMNLAGVASRVQQDGVMPVLLERRRELAARVRALPGVAYVSTASRLPLRDAATPFEFQLVDASGRAADDRQRADTRSVNPDYFEAMGIPLLRGTTLTADARFTFGAQRDSVDGPRPLVVSASAAQRFWPGEDPIGKTIRGGFFDARVVGVVGDVRQIGLAQAAVPTFYMPETPQITATLIVRAAGDPQLLVAPIRDAIRDFDRDQPIRSIATLRDVAADSIASDRFFTLLYVAFGGLALTLAAVGVYGVVAYSVGLRTQEIGLRVAVGARAGDILRGVVGSGMRPVVAGVAAGVGLAMLLAKLIERQLYGVSASDPATFLGAPGVLIAIALLACYLPARRAAKIDPVVALRTE